MIIAVDFDGTIVSNKYPGIGNEIPYAVDVLHRLQQENHTLILWTCRTKKDLEDAIDWCAKRGLFFYSVNSNLPMNRNSRDKDYNRSVKVTADIYIDNNNLGGIPDWPHIYQMISGKKHNGRRYSRKKSLLNFLKCL